MEVQLVGKDMRATASEDNKVEMQDNPGEGPDTPVEPGGKLVAVDCTLDTLDRREHHSRLDTNRGIERNQRKFGYCFDTDMIEYPDGSCYLMKGLVYPQVRPWRLACTFVRKMPNHRLLDFGDNTCTSEAALPEQ